MSAIAGLFRFDDNPIAPRELERMANALAAYGPDRSEIALAGNVGFAHALMRITPEDRFERQPIHGGSGVLLAADLRLDNRDEMLDRLGVAHTERAVQPDSRILLQAWEKLGNEVWNLLRGPFAAAVWDPRTRSLTLARDHIGFNNVVWYKSQSFFAFATMPKGLFALADVPREVNEQKLADFLVLNHAEQATTFYRNVYRVPPAHFATVDSSGRFSIARFWSAANVKQVRLPSDAAYAEAARAQIDRAVRRQLRSAGPVACSLSGGLDSSSVAYFAARNLEQRGQRLTAYTQVPRKDYTGPASDRLYFDETPYVEAIKSAIGNIDLTYIYNNEYDDFAELDRVSLAFEYPVRNPTSLGWLLAIPRLARAQNQRVLLTGIFGNFTTGWAGWSQACRHLLRGRLATAYRQYRALYRRGELSRWMTFRTLFIEPLRSDREFDIRDRLRGNITPWHGHSAIRPEFANEMQVRARAQQIGHDFRYRPHYGERIEALAAIDYLGEWFAAVKAMYGVETRDPLADIDLLEYCYGIPDEQYLVEDVDRSLIRRAMWGLLPPLVLTNRRMGMQAADWHEKLAAQLPQMQQYIADIAASPLARRAIDTERLHRALASWPASGWHTASVRNEYQLVLTRGISVGRFARWLDTQNRAAN